MLIYMRHKRLKKRCLLRRIKTYLPLSARVTVTNSLRDDLEGTIFPYDCSMPLAQ